MKILHVHTALVPGGIEAMVCALCNQMSKKHEVHLLLIFEPKPEHLLMSKLSPNVTVHTLGKIGPGFTPSLIFKIANFIKLGNFDAVNLHSNFYYSFWAVFSLHRKTKFFYTVHSNAVMENCHWDQRILCLKKFAFRKKYIKAISISSDGATSFNKLYKTKSNLIPNGIARPNMFTKTATDFVNSYRITADTKIFVHVGRITKAKNQEVLCRAFNRIIEGGADAVLLIIGPKDDNDIFSKIQPFLGSNIQYCGSRSDIPQILAASDAMLLPSIWEGAPVVLLEAIAVGCPPICTPVGGIPDIVEDGVNGLLSQSTNEEHVTDVINKFLNLNNEQIMCMKKNAYKTFNTYDIASITDKYLQYYTTNG